MSNAVVAIVGRPNVGKSTLFNRLVGEPVAIVEDVPGTTRDRVYADTSWKENRFVLVDTGGLEPRPTSDITERVKDQVEMAISEADAIIFLVDVRDGVMPTDLEIADALRRSNKPIVLGVNKADNDKRRHQAVEFYELALGDPIPISAYHGIGVSDLLDRVIATLPPSAPIEQADMMKVAIVGRPNVGKSMLLNAILGQERAIVSETPGTTRDAIDTIFHYNHESMLLIDTAGIRRRGRIESGIENYSVMRALRAISRADIALLVLDATEMVTAQDAHIAGYVWEAAKGMVLVVNKWDLIESKHRDVTTYTREIQQRLKFSAHSPILYVSAKLGQGVEGILAAARQVYGERLKRLPTALLNKIVNEAVAAHSPPTVGSRRLKFLYVTQAEVNPPTFVFFVNDAKLVHFSYRRYLENKLRAAFGFSGTPLRLIFKSRGET